MVIGRINYFSSNEKAPGDSIQVLISIQYHDEVIYNGVKSKLKLMNGVTYFTYCDNHALFMTYINNSVFSTKEIFLEKLIKGDPLFEQRIIILNGEFKDLVDFCEPQDVTDAANLKNSFIK